MTKVQITVEQVKRLAKMLKIDVTGVEDKLAEMFSDTLEKIEILKELDTSKTEETYQVTGLVNVFQQGSENYATLSKADALSNAQEQINGLFATKAVFNRD